MTNTFFYEDGQENVYKEQRIKVFGHNLVLETIDTQSSYLEARKSIEEKIVKKSNDVAIELESKQNTYNGCSVNTREVFIDVIRKQIKCHANFQKKVGHKSPFTTEHEIYIRLYTEDIIGELSKEFMGFSISKMQLNYHLRNSMLVKIKRFEPKVRDSAGNLQIRYEWFMKWKNFDLDFTKKLYL